MEIIAFILFIIAAVIFLVVPDGVWGRYNRGAVSFGLGVLTIGFIVQFCTTARQVHF